MKKLCALFLALVMLVGLLAACGLDASGGTPQPQSTAPSKSASTGNSDGTATTGEVELKPFVFANSIPREGVTSFVQFGHNVEQIVSLAGGSTTFPAEMQFTPDGVISFVESQVAAGADGLVICPPAESILPTITQLCEEAGIYWGISLRTIEDDSIREIVESSKYYVGNCYEEEEDTAYQVMKYLNEQGYSKIAIINMPVGDKAGDRRDVGIEQACGEFGMEVVAEARGINQVSDCTSATESFLSAHPDLDAIFLVATGVIGAHEAIAKAIQDSGRAVKLACIDWPLEMERLLDEGVLEIAASSSGIGGITYDSYMVTLKVLNAIQGHPIEGGKPFENTLSSHFITEAEEAAKLAQITNDETFLFYDDAYIQETLFKWNNPDLTQVSMQNLMNSYNPFE